MKITNEKGKKIQNSLAIFENFKIRRHYDEKKEEWYFSVIDIVAVLSESVNPTDYFKKLRKRDYELGIYVGTNCPQIEIATESGKLRKTLTGNTEHILRIIQSIPSKKAEPFKGNLINFPLPFFSVIPAKAGNQK